MNLVYLNFSNESIPHLREVHTILPCIAFSKEVASYSTYIGALINLAESEELGKDLKLLADLLYYVLKKGESEKTASHARDTLLRVHRARQKKMPTKAEMQLRAAGVGLAKSALDLVRTYYRNMITTHEMHRINSFRKNGLVKYYLVNIEEKKPEVALERTVTEFIDIVSEEQFSAMPVCTEQVVQGFDMAGMEQSPPAGWFEKGMLKLLQFEIPGFLNFKRSKYKLLRDELQPELDAWWNALDEAVPAVSKIPFSAEGLPVLKEKVMGTLAPAAGALNMKIKNSIYMQQLANDEYGEYRSTFSFVLTRRMTLLEAYHKTHQLPGPALQKLDEYFTGRNTAGNTVCFMLHELPAYPPMKTVEIKDEKWLDETWQQSMNE